MHDRSLKTLSPRISTLPGRNTSDFPRPDRVGVSISFMAAILGAIEGV